jgi:hypothetical protein
MSMREFCTVLTIQKNLAAIEKAWPDSTRLKGRGHVPRSIISDGQADCFRRFGYIPAQAAATSDGKKFNWFYVAPREAANLIRDLTQLADLEF